MVIKVKKRQAAFIDHKMRRESFCGKVGRRGKHSGQMMDSLAAWMNVEKTTFVSPAARDRGV